MEGLQLGVSALAVSNAVAGGVAQRAQRGSAGQVAAKPTNTATSASSHVGRMRQLQRGALGGEARAHQAQTQVQPLPASQQQVSALGAQGAARALLAQTAASQPPVTGAGVALANNSTSSFGSATPSTSSADAEAAAAAHAAMAGPANVLQFQAKRGKPKGMKRANQWTPEVENLFRFQLAGFQDVHEYLEFQAAMYAEPQPIEVWDTGFIRSLQNKNSNFMYFRKTRECLDKFLNKVKIYSY